MTTRDWGGYGSIIEEGRAVEAADREKPLVDCPLCGDILAINAAGERSCPMGHFRTNETTKRNWQ